MKQKGTLLLYDVGIKKEAGTLVMWFNTTGGTSTRYILASQNKANGILMMYLKSDNKLALAVRDSAGGWKELVESPAAVSANA